MTKEQLAALGLTEEQVDKAWKLFDGNYVPKDRFNEVNGKLKAAETSLAAANVQLDAQKGEKGDATALMLSNGFGLGDMLSGAAEGFIGDLGGDFALGALDAFNTPDFGTGGAGSVPDAKSLGFDKNKALGGIGKNTKKTADNTDKIKNAMDLSREDLKYMRDIAERQAVNRFTTAQISIDMTNTNQFASDTDVDGVLGRLTSEFAELLAVAAEEVHA